MVSLLPSMAVTLPLPNFWWKTRSPRVKAETVPVDLAMSSPSMVSGRRRVAAPGRRGPSPDRLAVVGKAVAAVVGFFRLRALPAGLAVVRAERRRGVEARGAVAAITAEAA